MADDYLIARDLVGRSVVERDFTSQWAAALPLPILIIGPQQEIVFVNPAAEQFFDMGASLLCKHALCELLPYGSPLLQLINQARDRDASVSERDVDLTTPRHGERVADTIATPLPGSDGMILLTLQERNFSQRLDRQLLHRGAVRSLHGMASVLAHEIKNPLAGIRGAAQLIEGSLPVGERELTQLICSETDRIGALIDRMEAFGDRRGLLHRPVNVHEVLDRARKVAETSFARHATFAEAFDPSLPLVAGDRDQLIQVFLNLVRNASDALPERGGEIVLTTGYRPGMRMRMGAGDSSLGLPLEVTVRDNGSGVPGDLLPHIFDPFVTTKARGSGLGLALAAKIVGDHGGVIECDSVPGRTLFRVMLPKADEGELTCRLEQS